MLVILCSTLGVTLRARTLAGPHEYTITANDFAYSPSRIDVRRNEIVRIAFRAIDILHTFTIDAYRIANVRAPDRQLCSSSEQTEQGHFRSPAVEQRMTASSA